MKDVTSLVTDNLDIWAGAIERKSAAGRGKSKKFSLYGIGKLRELILDLAVRGKLVPQDSNEEPASELLKRIKMEKARLTADGIIKKSKSLSPVDDKNVPYLLPETWRWMKLPDTYYSISPSSRKIKTSEFMSAGEFPIIDQGLEFISGYTDDSSLLIEIAEPVVIFGDHTKNLKYVDFSFVAGADGTKILCPVCISPKYFFLQLQSLDLEARGYARHFKVLNNNFFPMPPLNEQQRIVAKVDELLALCDTLEAGAYEAIEAHEVLVKTLLATLTNSKDAEDLATNWTRLETHFDTLFTTEASIDQLKQTILQLAVMGKLVPQNPDDEPALELLKRIGLEKEQLIAEGKIKKPKPLSPIKADAKPFNDKNGWEWCRLPDLLAIITDGDHQAPPKSSSGIPFLVIGNLNSGLIDFNDTRFVPQSYYDDLDWSKKPVSGDLLYTVTGSYGIPVRVVGSQLFCVQRHISILKTTQSSPTNYLYCLLQSKFAKDYADASVTGIAQKTLSLRAIRGFQVPVPPLAEQQRIVAKINDLMALCDTLKSRVANAALLQKQLADAIVTRAVV